MSRVNSPNRPSRRERAEQTRQRMIEAALAAFLDDGYVGAKMTDIAQRAGVAVQTLYYSFSTKAALLQACFDHAVLGPERVPPASQAFWQEIRSARSAPAALRAFARGNAAICARAAGINEVAKAARHEPEAATVLAHSEALRRGGFRDVVLEIKGRKALRRGLDVDRATDLLLVLGSPTTYLELEGLGWSHDEIVAWVAQLMVDQLIG